MQTKENKPENCEVCRRPEGRPAAASKTDLAQRGPDENYRSISENGLEK
jgi:hypothetical protein